MHQEEIDNHHETKKQHLEEKDFEIKELHRNHKSQITTMTSTHESTMVEITETHKTEV
jgi:hypothetical protein